MQIQQTTLRPSAEGLPKSKNWFGENTHPDPLPRIRLRILLSMVCMGFSRPCL